MTDRPGNDGNNDERGREMCKFRENSAITFRRVSAILLCSRFCFRSLARSSLRNATQFHRIFSSFPSQSQTREQQCERFYITPADSRSKRRVDYPMLKCQLGKDQKAARNRILTSVTCYWQNCRVDLAPRSCVPAVPLVCARACKMTS